MKFETVKIKLTTEDLKVAEAFAQKRMGSSAFYRNRGGFKALDIIVGALGEIAVSRAAKLDGLECSEPDFTIYEKGRKSYDADLITGCNRNLHVKTQNRISFERYGHSYLMQKSDPILREPDPDHYIAPCVVNMQVLIAEVYPVVPISDLLILKLLDAPKLSHLGQTKVAIYMEKVYNKLEEVYHGTI